MTCPSKCIDECFDVRSNDPPEQQEQNDRHQEYEKSHIRRMTLRILRSACRTNAIPPLDRHAAFLALVGHGVPPRNRPALGFDYLVTCSRIPARFCRYPMTPNKFFACGLPRGPNMRM